MARTFVFSDNLTAQVEIIQDLETGYFAAYCAGCCRGREVADLTEGTNTVSMEDAQQIAENHADQCTRCADEACRNTARHDAGHRCRKI